MDENNNKTSESLRAQLSEMDKIFVPEDLDDNLQLSDFLSYKCNLKFWRSVPGNCRLVSENVFTRVPKFVKGTGVKFIPPLFVKTILVPGPELEGIKTFKDIKCLSKDKIEIGMDLSLSMCIEDPSKYVRKGKHQMNQLTSIVNRLLRIYVANRNFDDLVVSECDIAKFDQNNELDFFCEENGIRINKVIFEKIELPERLKKLYNDAAEEEQRKKAQAVKLSAELDKAKTEAEILKIQSEAEAQKISKIEAVKNKAYVDKMSSLIETMLNKGVPVEEISDYVKTIIMSENGNTIFMGGNSKSNDIAMGVAAGKRAESAKKVEETSQFERLFNYLQLRVKAGLLSEACYNKIFNRFGTPDIKKFINSLEDKEYENLLKDILVAALDEEKAMQAGNIKEENGVSGRRK